MKWLDRATVLAPFMTLCLTEKEFLRAAKHCRIKDPGSWLDEDRAQATCHTWQSGSRLVCIVCLHPDLLRADPITVAATIVHESVHAFQRLCDSIGESQPSREFEAYSIERISERLMREFARRVKES